MKKKFNPYIFSIIISIPIMLIAILRILPTFDDWTTLSSPNYDNNIFKYVIPYGTTWRPFDALMGYINAINYKLYPTINHILIFAGHIGSTFVLYKILSKLDISGLARDIAIVFFYISPCVCGTIFSCDSLNQTYSHLWGMVAVYMYLTIKDKRIYFINTLLFFAAALSKDNGITWTLIPPVIAFAFGKINSKELKKGLIFGITIAVIYALIRLSLPRTPLENCGHTEQILSLNSKIKGLGIWIGYTWFAIDYISIFHIPSRNLLLAAITALLSTPFIAYCFLKKIQLLRSKTFIFLVIAMIICASANIVVSMSVMNSYCTLGIAAIIIAYLINNNSYKDNGKLIYILFSLYIITALYVDFHNWYKSWKTSLPSKQISEEIINKTGKPVNNVYLILIKDKYTKYSSFCVTTDETVGWGIAMMHETGYRWPKHIKDTTINYNEATKTNIRLLTNKALESEYDCVWIVGKDIREVIKKDFTNKK